jgi:hypothetical protein
MSATHRTIGLSGPRNLAHVGQRFLTIFPFVTSMTGAGASIYVDAIVVPGAIIVNHPWALRPRQCR